MTAPLAATDRTAPGTDAAPPVRRRRAGRRLPRPHAAVTHLLDSEDPDGHLVLRAGRGDQAAVRELVDRHLNPLMAVARHMLGTAEDAEEVVQEVFLRVWTHAARWQPGRAKFSTWLHRVALNLCYDRLRRRREIAMAEPPDRADETPGPEARAIGADLAVVVDAALQALPERQRAALVLSHYQGLSQVEAAAALEVSVEALESLLSRGRRSLRDKLAPLARDHAIGGVAK